ncbi:hypothetical protein OH146_05325 [Salinibacterium sp. SYSU T00001]|uniref:hypothetical protein n=1 Tax=Homoserinimonas sedimenticola TaxID=2986805 RepID=UPI0022354E4E|nr:hypothetical protein [Salinibacterium sedimenticola]MCW4385191.1 hypothetical protein [Salinibacterium sedimenticola]
MSDQKSNQDQEPQEGAVRDVDAPEAEEDTTSGGAPEEPDTDPGVYDGGKGE